MSDAPLLSLSLLDDLYDFGPLGVVPAGPVNTLAYDATVATLSRGLISMSLVEDDEPLPQRIAS